MSPESDGIPHRSLDRAVPRIRREADLARRSRPGKVHRPAGKRASVRETATAVLPKSTKRPARAGRIVVPGKRVEGATNRETPV